MLYEKCTSELMFLGNVLTSGVRTEKLNRVHTFASVDDWSDFDENKLKTVDNPKPKCVYYVYDKFNLLLNFNSSFTSKADPVSIASSFGVGVNDLSTKRDGNSYTLRYNLQLLADAGWIEFVCLYDKALYLQNYADDIEIKKDGILRLFFTSNLDKKLIPVSLTFLDNTERTIYVPMIKESYLNIILSKYSVMSYPYDFNAHLIKSTPYADSDREIRIYRVKRDDCRIPTELYISHGTDSKAKSKIKFPKMESHNGTLCPNIFIHKNVDFDLITNEYKVIKLTSHLKFELKCDEYIECVSHKKSIISDEIILRLKVPVSTISFRFNDGKCIIKKYAGKNARDNA